MPELLLTVRTGKGAVDLDNVERASSFLGDRVLGLIASEALFSGFPDWDAGNLSKGLSRLVNATSIYTAAQRLDLGRHLRIGPGEEKTGGREKKRLLADAYEAITGAIYQDAGLSAASDFLLRTLIHPALASEAAEGLERADHKSALQEWLQQRGLGAVVYRLRSASGSPEHRKQFSVEVWHEGRCLADSEGSSKEEAAGTIRSQVGPGEPDARQPENAGMKSISADASPSGPEQIPSSMVVSPSPGVRPAIWARRFVWILALLAATLALTACVSLLIEHTRLKTRLTARMAAALGRPVEVGGYEFTLWGGPHARGPID